MTSETSKPEKIFLNKLYIIRTFQFIYTHTFTSISDVLTTTAFIWITFSHMDNPVSTHEEVTSVLALLSKSRSSSLHYENLGLESNP